MNYIFDLDNTLIYSDLANNISYSEAVKNVIGANLDVCCPRITRGSIKAMFPELSADELSKVVQEKERQYAQHISKTMLNIALVDALKYLKANNMPAILLTYSTKHRAEQLLTFQGISNLFAAKYYKEDYGKNTKYKFATSALGFKNSEIILFENEQEGMCEAVNDGIMQKNIIKFV